MKEIIDKLFELQDLNYKKFIMNLTPTINEENTIGVRVPFARKYAKEIKNTTLAYDFIGELPHKYYDEYMLHGLLVNEIKDYNSCVNEVDKLIPYIDNWAVCDSLRPKALGKNKIDLYKWAMKWINSDKEFVIRYGIETLLNFFLDDDFNEKDLEIVSNIKSNFYYVRIMIAWYFSFALIKQYDLSIKYIENKVLDKWIHNMTIKKACESYRISDDIKEYLKGLII